jgi:hypothetical protein
LTLKTDDVGGEDTHATVGATQDDANGIQARQSNMSTLKTASWWTVRLPPAEATDAQPPLVARCLQLLMSVLTFPRAAHMRSVSLAACCLFAYTTRCRIAERALMHQGLGEVLLRLCEGHSHPSSLRETAAAFLADLLADAAHREHFVAHDAPLSRFARALVDMVGSAEPRLEACALRCLGHLTAAAPAATKNSTADLAAARDDVMGAGGVEAIHMLLLRHGHAVGLQHVLPARPLPTPPANKKAAALLGGENGGEEMDPYFAEEWEPPPPPEEEIGSLPMLAHALRVLRNLSVRPKLQVGTS